MVWVWVCGAGGSVGMGVERQAPDSPGIMEAVVVHSHFMVYGISGPHMISFVTHLFCKHGYFRRIPGYICGNSVRK